mgnify:CR=1 FL=1
MSYTNGLDNPELYFQTKIYTGDGNDNRAITFDGSENMQPDLTWFKSRSAATWHNVYDSVRGANKSLATNASNAEETRSDTMDSFDSNGFTLGNDTSQSPNGLNTNASGYTYVAWCWKESATAGFDIVSYTGNGSNRTISHSLSAKPAMMIVKQRSASRDWWVYNKNLDGTDGATGVLYLSTTDAAGTSATTSWNSTAPTTSVFSLGTTVGVNKASQTYIAYLFAEKQGFSKFGSYIGNGNNNGTFVYLGFRPAWLLIKRSSASGTDWILHDNKRAGFNVNDDYLAANTSAAEVTGNTYQNLDLLANGFKMRGSGTGTNTSGETYVYMAIAESSFVNSSGVPNNAR